MAFRNEFDAYLHCLSLLVCYSLINVYIIGHVTRIHPFPYVEIFLIFMFFGMIMWKNDLGTVDTDKLSTFTDLLIVPIKQ